MAELKAQSVFDGGHWYTADGQAAYEQPKADGSGTRPTTLRDARKLGLLPSVTTILGTLDKPQLTLWKVKTAIRAADSLPRNEGEEVEAWVDRVVEKAAEPVAEAADLGTRIHAAIEAACKGEEWDSTELGPYVAPVLGWLLGKLAGGGRIVAQETVLASKAEGFAGRVDLIIEMADKAVWVVDWKSRKTRPGESEKVAFAPYPTQQMQLAAYAAIYAGKRPDWPRIHCANVITSSTEPGRFAVVEHAEPAVAWEAFKHVCAVWRWSKGYDPRG